MVPGPDGVPGAAAPGAGASSAPATPPPPAAPPTGRRRRLWPWWLGLGAVVVLVVGAIVSLTVEIGYYEFRPGSARPTAGLVMVPDDVESYPPGGTIAFTTVTLRRSTIASYVGAWFDGDVEVVEEELILGDRSPQENRQFNLALMDTSKQDAIRVALLQLGYEVPVRADGVVVVQVQEGSAADGVLEPGDTVVAIDGEVIDDIDDVGRIMGPKGPGTEVVLTVEPPTRDAQETVEVTLQPSPDEPERGLIGILLEPRNPVYEFPFEIDIDSGAVGGPSAGLAFTLAVLDRLTPGELTGGLDVAVTGTIDGAGNVGEVGGVLQKTAAVVDAGYDVFLVPSAEVDMAARRAGDAVQVIGVDTLDQALEALASLGGSGLGSPAGAG